MFLEKNLDIFILMFFSLVYIIILLQFYSVIKKRQMQKQGDKKLTMSLIDEAKKYNSDLYKISAQLSNMNLSITEKNDVFQTNITTIMAILNLYSSLTEGSSRHILNKQLISVLMNDNFIIAQKAFSPYFPYLRDQYNNQQLFVSFEYQLSRNEG